MNFAPSAQPPLLTDLPLAYRLVNPAQATGAKRLLLLLHGVGGNELNLLPVGEQLADAHTLVLSVRAPLVLGPMGFGFYQVDFSSGKPVFNQAQQLDGQRLLLDFIREASARYGIVGLGDPVFADFAQEFRGNSQVRGNLRIGQPVG